MRTWSSLGAIILPSMLSTEVESEKLKKKCKRRKRFLCEGRREIVWNMIFYGRRQQGESYTECPFFVGSRAVKTDANVSNGASEGLAEK